MVDWEAIRKDPPRELKISPVAAIPHKSKDYRSILDLSFRLHLDDGGVVPAVNETSTKTAPGGAIDQIGHSLKRVIHAFAESDDNEKIFMAKWDIKDLLAAAMPGGRGVELCLHSARGRGKPD